MGKYKLGLISMKLGDIAEDGDMGTDLSAMGDTVAGSALLDTTEAATADFKIEESDSPVLSIKTEADKIVLSWSTYNNSVDNLIENFGGTKANETAGVATLGTITPGSAYTNGVYTGVPLTGGTGTGAVADITVASGGVTAVTIVEAGKNYAASDALSADAADIGGTGSGFSVVAATVVATSTEVWEAPDAIPEIEKSLKATWKQGGFIKIPRAKIVAKLAMSFKRDALSQIDITATVLQPTKVGVKRMYITNEA